MSEIGERVKKIVVEHLGVEPDKVVDAASFIDDLGADSLDTVELVMAFEEEFGCEIPDDAAETILTVGDATKFLEKNAKSRPRDAVLTKPGGSWPTVHRFLVMGRQFRAGVLYMRRVVVTGLGMVSPLGCGVEPTWKRILNAESGARPITTFEVSDLPSKIACIVPRGDGQNATFNPDQWMEPKD